MFLLMACCISWSVPVRMNTANSVETVTTGRTMVNVFMDVVLGRMDCMPNMLWFKNGLFVRTKMANACDYGFKGQCLQLRTREGERG